MPTWEGDFPASELRDSGPSSRAEDWDPPLSRSVIEHPDLAPPPQHHVRALEQHLEISGGQVLSWWYGCSAKLYAVVARASDCAAPAH